MASKNENGDQQELPFGKANEDSQQRLTERLADDRPIAVKQSEPNADGEVEEYRIQSRLDTQPYYLVGDGDGASRVDCDELPSTLPKGQAYATATQINAYQADPDTDKRGVDLTPSSVVHDAQT
jgi:hypothetical protein